MNKKTILAAITLFLVLVGVGIALNPAYPPPVNQKLGINDTNVQYLTTDTCRGCHNPSTQGGNTVQFRHHLLEQSGEYKCVACHPRLSNGGNPPVYSVIYEKSCLNCHNGSAFWANLSLAPGIPHHNTTWAYQDKNCSMCHGGYVDKFDDGHYVPPNSQLPTEVTPDTSFKIMNSTSPNRKWGGCESCHEPNATAAPFPIWSNPDTHHNLGKVTQGYPLVSDGCLTCHNTTVPIGLNIRKCEDCHGIKSLHNIQYNYTETVSASTPGYGHLGDGDKDCLGCHSWYVAGAELPPTIPVPEINTITPSDFTAGVAKQVTISGGNFYADYTKVAVDGVDIGGTVTGDIIVATVPALTVGTHTIDVVNNGDVRSRLYSIVATTLVDATKAQITSTKSPYKVTITGTGFGNKPDAIYEPLGVWITTNSKSTRATIVSWTDTTIVVSTKTKPVKSNSVAVKALFGQDTININ
jgi:hypothetical protein